MKNIIIKIKTQSQFKLLHIKNFTFPIWSVVHGHDQTGVFHQDFGLQVTSN